MPTTNRKVLWIGTDNNGVRTLLAPATAHFFTSMYEAVANGSTTWEQIHAQVGCKEGYPGIATFRAEADEHVTGDLAMMEIIKQIARRKGYELCYLPTGNVVPQSNQVAGELPSPMPEEFLEQLGIKVTDDLRAEFFGKPALA